MARIRGRQVVSAVSMALTRGTRYLIGVIGLELTRAVMAATVAGLLVSAIGWIWGHDHTALIVAIVTRGISLGIREPAGILAGLGLAMYVMLVLSVLPLLIARHYEHRYRDHAVARITAGILMCQLMMMADEDRPQLITMIDDAPDNVDLEELIEQVREPNGRPIYAVNWPVR